MSKKCFTVRKSPHIKSPTFEDTIQKVVPPTTAPMSRNRSEHASPVRIG